MEAKVDLLLVSKDLVYLLFVNTDRDSHELERIGNHAELASLYLGALFEIWSFRSLGMPLRLTSETSEALPIILVLSGLGSLCCIHSILICPSKVGWNRCEHFVLRSLLVYLQVPLGLNMHLSLSMWAGYYVLI